MNVPIDDIPLCMPMMMTAMVLMYLLMFVVPLCLGTLFCDMVIYKRKWRPQHTRTLVQFMLSIPACILLLIAFGFFYICQQSVVFRMQVEHRYGLSKVADDESEASIQEESIEMEFEL